MTESRDELVEQVRSGTLLKPGDRIRVVTADGAVREVRVAEIRADGTIVGDRGEAHVDEIVLLERRERSWIKTGLLIGLVGVALFGSDCEDEATDEYGEGWFSCP